MREINMTKYNSDTCRMCEFSQDCIKSYGNPHDGCKSKFRTAKLTKQEAKQKAHELVVSSIRTETAREIFDWLKTKQLMISEIPEEGHCYQFLGCYITKFGKTDEPTLGLTRLQEDDGFKELKLKYGVE